MDIFDKLLFISMFNSPFLVSLFQGKTPGRTSSVFLGYYIYVHRAAGQHSRETFSHRIVVTNIHLHKRADDNVVKEITQMIVRDGDGDCQHHGRRGDLFQKGQEEVDACQLVVSYG